MNEKWFSLTIPEIENKLKTNAASGLSRKAARSRLKKQGRNNFFFLSETSAVNCIKRVLSDPMLLLLIAVDIIAAVFGSVTTAAVCGVIIAVNIASAVFLYIKSCRVAESMAEYSQPKIKVIRDGKLYCADARAVVRGDIILLEAGDVLPCDVRLISSFNLTVSVFGGKEENTVKKNAQAATDGAASPLDHENMVHAGSYIVDGTARAIVVETGKYSYIGALEGGIPLNHTVGSLGALKKLRKISKNYAFVLMAAILPLTVIGIFAFGAERLLDTFMLVMAISVSALGELIYVVGGVMVSAGLTELALDKKDPAIVKNIESLDKIAAPDYLFLLDDAALTDGSFRVSKLIIGDDVFEGEKIFAKEATRFFELLIMTEHARSLSPSVGAAEKRPIFEAAKYFGNRIGIDINSFPIRVKSSAYYPRDDMHFSESAALLSFGERVTAFVSSCADLIEKCSFIRLKNGALPLDEAARSKLLHEARMISSQGYSLVVCASSNAAPSGRPSENGLTLEGIAAFSKNRSFGVVNYINELEKIGTHVVVFTSNGKEALEVSRLIGVKYATDNSIKNIDKHNVISNVTPSDIKKLTEKLQKAGKTVAVAAIDNASLKIAAIADFSVSYGVSAYRTSGVDVTALGTASLSDSEGAQILRFSSDGLIKRAGKNSGGLSAILNMMRVARGIHINLENVLTYLICSQTARVIIAAIVTLCTGVSLLTPAQLLFTGLLLDFFAAIACAFDSYGLSSRKFFDYSLKDIIKKIKIPLISVSFASIGVAVGAVFVAISIKSDVSRAVFCSVTLLQAALFFSLRHKAKVKNVFSPIAVAVFSLSIVLSVLIALITPLAVLFGASGASPLSLALVPTAPALFCALYFLFNVKKPKNSA